MSPVPDGYRSPFDDALGTRVEEASAERVVLSLAVGVQHHQPTGVVHGGVYATLVETAASIAANLWLDGTAVALGASNHTDFLGATRDGELRAEATPLQRGRNLQLWVVDVTDGSGRRVAHGKVRLFNLPRAPV